ncbi:MAG: homoaconitase large subunit [Methanobacteriales archaeon]|nr:3-isopropylmalate dehydratase large subunit [Methanobacteriaceae archaeon]
MNITEKILAKAAGKKEVQPGEIIEVDIDLAMTHDGTSPPTIKTFKKIAEKTGQKRVWNPKKIVIVYDHNIPPNSIGAAEFQKVTREFAKEQGITNIFKHGEGICHQVLPEKGFIKPGNIIIGADSHTCTYGAFGAFATGMGATDMAMIFSTGKTWLRVPESMKIEVEGGFQEHVTAKDLILHIIGELGVEGATYKSVEFTGETIKRLEVPERMTICNMTVEMGAKNGIIEPNKATIEYLKERLPQEKFKIYTSDPDYDYHEEFYFNIDDLEPQIACPNSVDNVKDVRNVLGTHIDEAFIGSCTNGRFEDLRMAAEILKDEKIHDDVRMIIVPASSETYLKALKKGLIKVFIDAGAIVCNPGCGPCLGAHMGVLSSGEVCISTSNRNFQGRMGDPKSKVYLANPIIVAQSAIKGEISIPE